MSLLPIRGFISYSTVDRHVAAEIKKALRELGVDAFTAHDDLLLSQIWRDRILDELKSAEVFVPVLSAAFRQSDWASQEVGVAMAQPSIVIAPISLDGTIPFGFISHIQGLPKPKDLGSEFFMDAIASRFPRQIIARRIEILETVGSWRTAERLVAPLVPYFAQMTDQEVGAFAEVAVQNGEIWDAADCRKKYLPEFIAKNESRIPTQMLVALRYQLKHAAWYQPDTDEPV